MIDELAFVKSQIFECYHKVTVKNPYTNEILQVPCGTCPACLMRNSFFKEQRCKMQQYDSKYCYFITLSYKNKFIPRFLIESIENVDDEGSIVNLHLRSIPRNIEYLSTDSFQTDYTCPHSEYVNYTKKANLAIRKNFYDKKYEWTFSYLDKKDISLFIKRIRKDIFKITGKYEQIHTYIVGEYGPEHFRAHWHILLFFDSDSVSENLRSIVNKNWPFGRIDFSFAREAASSYVAGYVNSFTCLPSILRQVSELKPKSRFSNYFGFRFMHRFRERIISGKFDHESLCSSVKFHGSSLKFSPSINYVRSFLFFPPCAGNCDLSSYLSFCYTTYKLFRHPLFRAFKGERINISAVSDNVVKFLYIARDNFKYLSRLNHDVQFNTFLRRFGIDDRFLFSNLCRFTFDQIKGKIYRFLLHFSSVCRNYCYDFMHSKFDECLFVKLFNNLKGFYHEKILAGFRKGVKVLVNCPEAFRIYYFGQEKRFGSVRQTDLGKKILSFQYSELLKRIKHREINDLHYVLS